MAVDLDDLQAEVRDFLDTKWDPDLELGEWWQRLCDSGFGVPTWPEEWHGRGLSGEAAKVVHSELSRAGAPGCPAGLGIMLAGPTILAHGTDEQKQRYLRPIVSGEEAWCQLFSEPGAGSDLASLQCRAERDGDEWLVSGQKVWSSMAHTADLGMLLCRTDVDVPKHGGISYFAFPMEQHGVDIRPLREMTGEALFNEVFLDEARVADDALLGGLNNGWSVAMTTLMNERVALGGGARTSSGQPGSKAGMLDLRAGDLATKRGRGGGGLAAAFAGRSTTFMTDLARELGRTEDASIRQDLARLYTYNQISTWTGMRSKAAIKQGGTPGPEANTAKLNMSRMTRLSREVGLRISGARGMLWGGDAPRAGAIGHLATFSPAVSIYGGSDEVQRNIIGERVLGLPKEPSADKGVAFRDLRVGTQRG